MRNLLDKRDPWGQGLALWVFVAIVFAAPLTAISLRGLTLENDVSAWLSPDDPDSRMLSWYESHFPGDDHLLVTWAGSTLDDPRVGRLAARLRGRVDADGQLRGGLPFVKSVLTPHDLLQEMVKQGVSTADAVQRMEGVLIGAGPLKVRLTDAGRESPERTSMRLIKDADLQLGLRLQVTGPVEVWTDGSTAGDSTADPGGNELSREAAVTDLALEFPPHDLQVSWHGIWPGSAEVERFREWVLNFRDFPTATEPEGRRLVADCFFAAGSPVALLLTLSESGELDLAEAVTAIRRTAADVGVAEDQLHIVGRPIASLELANEVRRAVWDADAPWFLLQRRSLLLLACLVSIALALYFLRSAGLGLLVIGTAGFASLVGVSLVPLAGQPLNMVLIAMPVLLTVLALSGAIHVANYWRHAALELPRTAVSRATQMARAPSLIATGTIILGMLALAYSRRLPVRQFGLFTAAGCLIGLVVVLYGLPSLLQVSALRPPRPGDVNDRRWATWATLLGRRPGTVIVCCGLLFLAGAAGLNRFETTTQVVRNFPEETRLIRDFTFVEGNVSGVTPLNLVVRFTPQAQEQYRFLERVEIVRRVEDELRRHPDVSGVLGLADFLPVQAVPGADARRLERVTFNRRSNELESEIKSRGHGTTGEFLAADADDADLRAAGDQHPGRAGDELWRITIPLRLRSSADCGLVAQELSQRVQGVTRLHAGADHVLTGTALLFHQSQRAVLASLIKTFSLASFVMGVLLVWMLRSPLAASLAMLACLLPIGCVLGVVSLCGVRIDVGTMITAVVGLGIAVNGMLHLLTWFRDGLRRGRSRRRAMIEALAHCGPALWQSNVAVGLGLLNLAMAELQLISRFGWMMSALIGSALLADLILLPALLAGPLGALLQKSLAVHEEAGAADRATVAPPHIRFRRPSRDVARPAI
jgi:predicted RND superfamily exporter protein